MTSATVPVTADDLAACCSPVTGGVLETAAAERLAHVFKALADPARVKLLSLIAAAKDGEACICDLTVPLELSQPTVSHHMKLLVDAGLVSREQRGKWAYYRVNDWALERVAQLISPARA
jgi:ArsR family transcriptional regulator